MIEQHWGNLVTAIAKKRLPSGGISSSPPVITYLLRDEFYTALAAGSVNGTLAEPGPGTRVVVDTNSKLSITGGNLSVATGGGGTDEPRISYGSLTRTAGRVLIAKPTVTTEGVIIALSDLNTASRQSAIRLYDTSIGIDIGAASWIAAGAYSTSTAYQIVIVLKAAGEYVFAKGGTFTNWELLFVDPNGASTPLYPIIGADDNASVYTVDYIRVPDYLWLPTPLAYDTFTRANGALGNSETSGPDSQSTPARTWVSGGTTWAIASNEAVNTPTEGADVIVNGGFDADSDWNKGAGWSIAAGVASVNNSGTSDIDQTAVSANTWYNISYDITSWTGGSYVLCRIGNINGAGRTSAATFNQTLLSTGTIAALRASGSPVQASVDNFIVKSLTTSELMSSVETSTADVVASIEVDYASHPYQCGMVLNLDNKDNPQNFVLAIYDRSYGGPRLLKCVAGVYTYVISAYVAYAAGANLVVVKEGTSYSLYYNNAQVGTTQTISDAGIISNTLHGMFSTYSGNQLDNFQVFPRGTNNEYQKLSDF